MKISLIIKRVLLGCISILIIFFFLRKIEVQELIVLIANIKVINTATFFILFIVTYFIRVLRLMIAFNIRTWSKCFQFIGLFQLINRTLPFRSGEIFFPILMKRIFSFKYSSTVFDLIIIRFFDLVSLLVVFLITITWFKLLNELYIILIFLVCIMFTYMFFYYYLTLIEYIHKLFITIFPKYSNSANTYRLYAESAYKKDKSQLLILFLLSIADKVIGFLCLIIIVYSLGFSIEYSRLLAAIGLSGFTEILPINSLGNFGTLELGWVGALVYLEVDTEVAIKSGFATHLIHYSITVIIGCLCFVSFLFTSSNKKIATN